MLGQNMTGESSQKPRVNIENIEVLCENKIFKETLYTVCGTIVEFRYYRKAATVQYSCVSLELIHEVSVTLNVGSMHQEYLKTQKFVKFAKISSRENKFKPE